MSEATAVSTDLWPGVARVPSVGIKARVARLIVKNALSRFPVRAVFANGDVWGHRDGNLPVLKVDRPQALFARLGADSKIGFGEAYMAGDWTTGPDTDLADLLSPFAAKLTNVVPDSLRKFRRFVDANLPHHERNTLEGSAKNIQRHYDLSNDLFAQFLDPTMTYSSAWFEDLTHGADLETAQERKMDAILDYAEVTTGTRVLEIGSGWGALAIQAAQRGAKVTTLTISHEQAALARERFAAAGVDVDLQLRDYREVSGEYDAIVSVEMIEAVGEEYWPTYFKTIDRVLAPGGRVSLQGITMAHDRYQETRNSYGWIQKYIFPGGLIPSLQAIDETLAEHTSLAVEDSRAIGEHYAETLRQWRERFNANWPAINAQGFDETFRRMWEFYLAYCEAGFRVGYINVHQLKITRPEVSHG
ncbi:cyclopropane-fatty-acyl-phospholipid synthase family protein [soil metagenome]